MSHFRDRALSFILLCLFFGSLYAIIRVRRAAAEAAAREEAAARYAAYDAEAASPGTPSNGAACGGLFPSAGIVGFHAPSDGGGSYQSFPPTPEARAGTIREAASVSRLKGSGMYGSINVRPGF